MNSTYIKEQKTVNISISDKDNILYNFLNSDPNVKVIEVDDVKTAFAGEIISFNVIIPDNFDQKIQEYDHVNIKIQTNSDNKTQETAILQNSIKSFSSLVLSEHLKEKGLPSNLQNQIQIENENLGSNNNFFAISLFSMIIPLFFILFCCIGTSGIAADLTSGEKEKATIEYLLSTGANRNALIMGKLLAVAVLGIISVLSTIIGLIYSIAFMNFSIRLNFLQILVILVIFLFESLSLSAINLAIGLYSKSYKEAQTYLTVTSLVLALPSALVYNIDVKKVPVMLLNIPIVNVVTVVKEIMNDIFNFSHILIVLLWIIVYTFLSFLYTCKLFKKEKVIFRV